MAEAAASEDINGYIPIAPFMHAGQTWRVNNGQTATRFDTATAINGTVIGAGTQVRILSGVSQNSRMHTNLGWIPISHFGRMSLVSG